MKIPGALLQSLQHVKGFNEASFIHAHTAGEKVTSIRFNKRKIAASDHPLFNSGIEKVPWSSCGYYLPERPSFTRDPLFHAGAYYVQEASSMFLEEILLQLCDLKSPLKVLDLCAAPGGKSTLIQSLISDNSILVSNEVIKTRVVTLAENISKWGAANVVVTNNDPRDFNRLSGYFDLILVDAPCSGSGLFRKDADSLKEWSESNVALCSQRQKRILADILPALKPGGLLVYATCSYSVAENEEICDWLLADEEHACTNIPLRLNAEWNITTTVSPLHNAYGYRFFPDKLKGEGFFTAVFQKKDSHSADTQYKELSKDKSKMPALSKAELDIISPLLNDQIPVSLLKWQEGVLGLAPTLAEALPYLQKFLYIKKAGIKIGTVIRKDFIPDHELALSNLYGSFFDSLDTDLENALQYLRRAELNIETETKGWVLLKYRKIALGWVKILQNRINNYYPKGWRIINK